MTAYSYRIELVQSGFPSTGSSSITEEKILVLKDCVRDKLLQRWVHLCNVPFHEEGFSKNGAEVSLKALAESLEISEFVQFGDVEDHNEFIIHMLRLSRGSS